MIKMYRCGDDECTPQEQAAFFEAVGVVLVWRPENNQFDAVVLAGWRGWPIETFTIKENDNA